MALSFFYLGFVRILQLLRLFRRDSEQLAIEVDDSVAGAWGGSSSSPRLCCAGTGTWSDVDGPIPTDVLRLAQTELDLGR
jgi:hypothetical protein